MASNNWQRPANAKGLPHPDPVRGRSAPELVAAFLSNPPKKPLHRLLRVLQLEPRALALIFVGTVVASIVSLGQPLLAGRIAGVVQSQDFMAALPFGIAMAGLALLASGINAGVNLLSAKAGNRAVREFRDESATISMRVPADKLVEHPTADLVARCSIDSERLNEVFSRGPIQALGGIVMVIGALIQMTIIDPILTLAALTLTVTCLAGIITLSSRLTSISFHRQEAQGAYVAELSRTLGSVLTLRAFVADAFAARRLKRSSQHLLDASNRTDKAQALMGPLITICIQITLVLIIGVAIVRVQAGELSIEELVTFFMFTMLIISPILGSTDTVMEMAESLGALQRIINLREVTAQHDLPIVSAVTGTSNSDLPIGSSLVGDVEFHNVTVTYPRGGGSRGSALSDVSFAVPAGSWVAMTGSSGSGKSTALSLLEKFVVPTEGTILVDGVSLAAYDDDAYRRQVGYIEQSCPLFSGTVRDNLLLGRHIDDDQCWEIIRQVGLADTIFAREGGLDAPVGESAYAFSGGERQRLAIARTLIGRPRLLLLDEITSGLDVLNRGQVMDLIRTTMGDITTFAAGHGHFGIDVADLVLVLDEGRLVEFGPPDEVSLRSPLFRSLIAH